MLALGDEQGTVMLSDVRHSHDPIKFVFHSESLSRISIDLGVNIDLPVSRFQISKPHRTVMRSWT